jgi:hypothetical protein
VLTSEAKIRMRKNESHGVFQLTIASRPTAARERF